MTFRPIGETAEAEDLYGPFLWGDIDLYERFLSLAEQVRAVAPQCVGMSVVLREHGITLTAMASDRPAAAHGDRPIFSEAARSHGVLSTLSLPVRNLDEPMAGFTLYGGTCDAFHALHDELSGVLGTWAEDALVDDDPALCGLVRSRLAPAILREATDLTIAAALLAEARNLDVGEAELLLREAASRGVIPLSDLLGLIRHVLAA
ncbi:hypothetical protein [Nocardioides sp.]|uniref:hypothetical protein n=1 Tax=Nocardioides sp. TaxID=35761 RepID=UPI003219285A